MQLTLALHLLRRCCLSPRVADPHDTINAVAGHPACEGTSVVRDFLDNVLNSISSRSKVTRKHICFHLWEIVDTDQIRSPTCTMVSHLTHSARL